MSRGVARKLKEKPYNQRVGRHIFALPYFSRVLPHRNLCKVKQSEHVASTTKQVMTFISRVVGRLE